MTVDELRAVLLAFPEAVEEQPFGPGVLVYKVAGKVFGIMPEDPADGAPEVTLKCDPDWAIELRAEHAAVRPGYHVNKRHWNTVTMDGSVAHEDVLDVLDHSYERVVASLPRAERERLLLLLRERAR
ncbi:MAG: MmcQ/YjbR family DNA-binding protein [Frankiaceae bacterium]